MKINYLNPKKMENKQFKKLIVFDMDGTILCDESLTILAEKIGIGKKVSKITFKAMNGEINFKDSVNQKMKLLKGMKEEMIHKIDEELKITRGVFKLIEVLKKKNYLIGIISGGFDIITKDIAKKVGVDFFIANKLILKNKVLSGDYELLVNKNKGTILKSLMNKYKPEKTIAVGDGFNDIPMLKIANVGIAFNAKPIVRNEIKKQINEINIMKVLDFID